MAFNVVLTGAGRGLGRALTAALAAAGHRVLGCTYSQKSLEDLRKSFGDPHRFQQVDVADPEQVAAWTRGVLDEVGPPDLVLNNAGLINANAPLWEVPDEEFSRVVDVNLKGPFHVLKHFLPSMIERGSGVVVNFSSTWGRTTSPEVAPYCATKFAVEGLTSALAAELPPGLAAVAFNPGVIDTDMLRSCFGGQAAGYPDPQAWARRALPVLLNLGPQDNGRSLSV